MTVQALGIVLGIFGEQQFAPLGPAAVASGEVVKVFEVGGVVLLQGGQDCGEGGGGIFQLKMSFGGEPAKFARRRLFTALPHAQDVIERALRL